MITALGFAATTVAALAPVGGVYASDNDAQATKRCGGQAATLIVKGLNGKGTSRADVIVVTNRRGARVSAGAGNDIVCGGPGNDNIRGGAGNDRLLGRTGKDHLVAGPGRDRLSGGAGRDSFNTRRSRAKTDLQAGEKLNGRVRPVLFRLRRDALRKSPSTVLAVREATDGGAAVTLRGQPRGPRVGQVLVVPAGPRTPVGVLGRVVAVSRDGASTTVQLKRARVDEAYSKLQVAVQGKLGKLARSVGGPGQSVEAARVPVARLQCSGQRGISADVSLDLADVEIDATLDTNPFNPQIGFSVIGRPRLDARLEIKRRGSCQLVNAPRLVVWIPHTPLVVQFRPVFEVLAQSDGSVSYSIRPRVVWAFHRGKRGPTNDVRSLRSDPTSPVFQGRGILAETRALLETSISAGGVVGIGGQLGPQVIADVSGHPSYPPVCARLSAELYGSLRVFANVFFRSWSFTLREGGVTPSVQLYRRCY